MLQLVHTFITVKLLLQIILLAAAGMMAKKNAGDLEEGMATWQHSDEQERLMTVDAANVSMVHNFGGEEYLS